MRSDYNQIPVVTVLMSVYNGEKYLRQAIDSILNQTLRDFEFVIYDDCSNDSTAEIINSYSDTRIVYRRNSSNKGLTANLADGVKRSAARYIARMDADDVAYSNRLKRQVEWMDVHPEITILGTPVKYFSVSPGDGALSEQPQDDATIKARLFIDFTLMHPSIMIRRDDLVNRGINYNTDFRYSQDHALYFDCIMQGLKFANYPEPLLHMRGHAASISSHNHGAQQECSKRARLLFLQSTGLFRDCLDSEIEIYNDLASWEFPDSPSKIDKFESFVCKVCSNPVSKQYFDVELLRMTIIEKLYDIAYLCVGDKRYGKAALRIRRSPLGMYIAKWPLKKTIKFYLKYIIKK